MGIHSYMVGVDFRRHCWNICHMGNLREDIQKGCSCLTLRRRLTYHLVASFVAIGVVAPIVVAFLDREPPFTLRDGQTLPPGLRAGQLYQFSWEFVPLRRRDCDGTVYWQIVDSQKTIWATPSTPSLFTDLSNAGPKSRIVGRERVLPSGIAPGPVALHSSLHFVCNWTHYLFPIVWDAPIVRSTVLPN